MSSKIPQRRKYWVTELAKLSGSFDNDAVKMITELRGEIKKDGFDALLDHLRFCGVMPEQYIHDSSEEKLYSKYTDAIISESLIAIGLKSTIITARADSADVQANSKRYSLVADAKAFRLSRTAKNQKDFKVQAMDGWRKGLDYAMIVSPIYQLPCRTSQIYQQAIARNVCILSYSHIATLVSLAARRGRSIATKRLGDILHSVSLLHPSKCATNYWTGINNSLVKSLNHDLNLWTTEKIASLESLQLAKEEDLGYLRSERNRLLSLTHREAIQELIQAMGLESRIKQIEHVEHGDLLGN